MGNATVGDNAIVGDWNPIGAHSFTCTVADAGCQQRP